MNLSDNAEEILEAIQILMESEKKLRYDLESIGVDSGDTGVKELLKWGLVIVTENRVSLTSEGQCEANKVIRRHRLAERLLVDVLSVEPAFVEDTACKLEHVIKNGIEDNICTLLGHPTVCPHGNPIPSGTCCTNDEEKTNRIVVALSQLESGQGGNVAYILTDEQRILQKLLAVGITPGLQIRLIQRYPSYVFQLGQTQIAVDEEIASRIFVLRASPE